MSEGHHTALESMPAVSHGHFLRRLIEPVVLAAGFLTIVPVRIDWAPVPRSFNRATTLFPAVGLAFGAIVAGADLGMRQFLPNTVTSALDLAILAVLSGGLHLDGLMDSGDGLFLSGGADRRLTVMKDSRVGSFGILALAFALFIQYSALSALYGSARTSALLIVPCLARWSMTCLLGVFPYARQNGLGSPFKNGLALPHLAIATLVCAGLVAAVQWHDLLFLPLTAVAAIATGQWISQRLGGLTGDSYGAISELMSTMLLVVIVGIGR